MVVTIEGGAAELSVKPEGFITGVEIWDYDVTEEYEDTETNEFGDRYQSMFFPLEGENSDETE